MDFELMLKTIRSNASERFKELIPEVTEQNLDEIGRTIIDDKNLKEEFLGLLMNQVAFRYIHDKNYKNHLHMLKKGKKPMGNTIEEIFIQFAKGDVYDPEGVDLLKRNLPEVKRIYHTRNRKSKYKVTINDDDLLSAFRSFADFGVFYNKIINSLTNGDERDEFLLFKNLFKDAIEQGFVKVIKIADPNASAANATKFIKQLKTVSRNMTYPSVEYNGYLTAQKDDDKALETFTDVSSQVIIIDTDTDVTFDVDVLANAFNISKQEFLARKIPVDFFPIEGVKAMLIDIDFPQIYDDNYKITSFYNPEGLYTNFYLHHWQTISASCLVNAVAFSTVDIAQGEGEGEE